MFKIGYRTIKTALGTTLAIVLAQILGLGEFSIGRNHYDFMY